MSDHKQATTANEPTGASGTECCKGMERLAQEDEQRSIWLDLKMLEGRKASRKAQAAIRLANYRKRMVPA